MATEWSEVGKQVVNKVIDDCFEKYDSLNEIREGIEDSLEEIGITFAEVSDYVMGVASQKVQDEFNEVFSNEAENKIEEDDSKD